MAKSFFETISTAGGLAGEYEALVEAEIAAGVGAAYSPPEADQVARVVAARTIQLMGGAPIYVETFQTSAFTLRVPKGSDGTAGNENDAQDGRLFFIHNDGTATGNITLETWDGGTVIGTIAPDKSGIILHGDNDNWDLLIVGSSAGNSEIIPLRYTSTGGVPGAGTRYLQSGSVTTSSAGDVIADDTVLVGISVNVDSLDLNRSYDVEILSDPSGIPAVIESIALPINTLSFFTFSLSVAIPSGTEVGARLIRATGGGASSFSNVVANVYLERTP